MFIPLFDIDDEYGYQKKGISNLFTPIVTTIIILCVVIFIYQSLFVNNIIKFFHEWGTSAYKFINAERLGISAYLSLITYSFLHANLWHILGNMWFFFIFGNNVEKKMGMIMFIIFYLTSAAVAALIQIVVLFPEQVFSSGKSASIYDIKEMQTPLVGASGAVSAVLGAYLRYFPRNYVATLVLFIIITIIPISASIFIGAWLIGQIINALLNPTAGVAWFAHLGGFAYGYLFATIYKGSRKEYYS